MLLNSSCLETDEMKMDIRKIYINKGMENNIQILNSSQNLSNNKIKHFIINTIINTACPNKKLMSKETKVNLQMNNLNCFMKMQLNFIKRISISIIKYMETVLK